MNPTPQLAAGYRGGYFTISFGANRYLSIRLHPRLPCIGVLRRRNKTNPVIGVSFIYVLDYFRTGVIIEFLKVLTTPLRHRSRQPGLLWGNVPVFREGGHIWPLFPAEGFL